MRPSPRRIGLSLVGLCFATAVISRFSPAGAKDESTDKIKVSVVSPERKTLTRKIEQPGEVRADEQAAILVRVSGYVKKVHKDIGQTVKEGDLLAELSVPDMDEELNQKNALVAQAKAEVVLAERVRDAAQADVKAAEAKVGEAKASGIRAAAELRRAESQLDRLTRSKEVVPKEVLEETQLGFDSAKAAVAEVDARVQSAQAAQKSAEAKYERAKADVGVMQAKQRVAEADQRRQAALVGYATLHAPFAGVVVKRRVDTGDYLQPGTMRQEAAFIVARIDPVRVLVDVPEVDAVQVTDGTRATVTVPALQDEEFEDEVRRTSWALDPRGRTLRAEIELKNPRGRLRPGMYVHSIIHAIHKDVPTVPASAIVTQAEENFCFLVEEGKARKTAVRLGFRQGNVVEVVAKRDPAGKQKWSAFTGEEKVIVDVPSGLTNGQAVLLSSR